MTLQSTSVLMRVDASAEVGMGHLGRCLTLADALRSGGARVGFACGGDVALCRSAVALHGFELVAEMASPEDVRQLIDVIGEPREYDTVVVDHYELDVEWERELARAGVTIAVIDDLARAHESAILLDQNLYAGAEHRYHGKVPGDCKLLLGPRYALLRPEFELASRTIRQRAGEVYSVLVSYGGSDPTNETAKAITALIGIPGIERIDVVIGPAMRDAETLRGMAGDDPRFTFHVAPDNMAELMAAADVALGAGGSTNWERCILGLPSLVTTVALNQVEVAEELASCGAIRLLGAAEMVDEDDVRLAVCGLVADSDSVRAMSVAARALMMDHVGVQRVAREILEAGNAES